MITRLAFLLVAALALVGILAGADGVRAGAIRPAPRAVALEGDAAPGTTATMTLCPPPVDDPSVRFTFDEPMVNAAGDTLFWSCLSDGGSGLFLLPFGGPMTVIERSGQVVPGVGTVPNFLGDGPAINNRGTSVFAIAKGITGVGAPTGALFVKERFGDLRAVAREGQTTPCGGTFRIFDDFSLNNKDDIAFIASYDDGAPKAGVFLLLANGTLSSVLCNGDSLPGTGTPNEKFVGGGGSLGVDGPYINDNDVVLVQPDQLTGPQVNDPETNMSESKWAGSVWARRPGQSIESFIMVGDPIPDSVGGGVVHGLGIGRPGFNNDGVLAFTLSRETKTDAHPAEQFVASKKLGSSDPIDICLEDLSPAPGGTFEGFGAVTINQKGDIAFTAEIDTNPGSEDENNPEADNTRGLFTCKDKQLTTVLLKNDNSKPRGHQWSHELEETSNYGPFVVFMDDVNTTAASQDRGVFLVGVQEDPIQGNFKCDDGHVDMLDVLNELKFMAAIPGITTASTACPILGQPESRTGFAWGDVNCDGAMNAADVTYFLAVLSGVPKSPSVASCRQISEVIPSQ